MLVVVFSLFVTSVSATGVPLAIVPFFENLDKSTRGPFWLPADKPDAPIRVSPDSPWTGLTRSQFLDSVCVQPECRHRVCRAIMRVGDKLPLQPFMRIFYEELDRGLKPPHHQGVVLLSFALGEDLLSGFSGKQITQHAQAFFSTRIQSQCSSPVDSPCEYGRRSEETNKYWSTLRSRLKVIPSAHEHSAWYTIDRLLTLGDHNEDDFGLFMTTYSPHLIDARHACKQLQSDHIDQLSKQTKGVVEQMGILTTLLT